MGQETETHSIGYKAEEIDRFIMANLTVPLFSWKRGENVFVYLECLQAMRYELFTEATAKLKP